MVKKRSTTTESAFTQVVPVVTCSDHEQVETLMKALGTVRSATYNKLGSLLGWSLDWKFAAPYIRPICPPSSVGLDKSRKVWEWSVNDCMKAISAQQAAAKVFLTRKIYQRYPRTDVEKERHKWLGAKPSKAKKAQGLLRFPVTEVESKRDQLLRLLNTDPTADNWLHRQFRAQYLPGHTFVGNQIVYQGAGYWCKRLTRNTVELKVSGINARGEKISLKLKCRHVVSGQIRLIKNNEGKLEVHCLRKRLVKATAKNFDKEIGVDKGYTEGFYTSEGKAIAAGCGKILTEKTRRITQTNRNRYRLRCHASSLGESQSAKRIVQNNLGYKVKSRKLNKEKATIKNLIRKDLRLSIATPTRIFAEDLCSPIKSKHQAKQINRKLNQWMKGELQDSLEVIAKETGSTVITVNPAYTSQVDSQTGTLLGQRNGDRFIRFTGVVLQADENAALNILHRGSDTEVTRWMKYVKVRQVLIQRTVRYLASIGTSVIDALNKGWLSSKFRTEALECEAQLSPQGV